MEHTGFYDFLYRQAPAIAIMATMIVFGFKFLTQQMAKKDDDIEKANNEIKILNQEAKDDMIKSFEFMKELNNTLKEWIKRGEVGEIHLKNLSDLIDNRTAQILKKISDIKDTVNNK